MCNVLPLAGTANRRKEARLEEAFLIAPHRDELFRRVGPVKRHRQIFALARTTVARRVDEMPDARQDRSVRCRMGRKGGIPLQLWRADQGTFSIVRGEEAVGESAGCTRRHRLSCRRFCNRQDSRGAEKNTNLGHRAMFAGSD